ncbi:MAG: hypothetical protein N2558_04950 [Patescibacteria group bacterium]|nr:hypothetical protein [Patescibacteria group bacterium]
MWEKKGVIGLKDIIGMMVNESFLGLGLTQFLEGQTDSVSVYNIYREFLEFMYCVRVVIGYFFSNQQLKNLTT